MRDKYHSKPILLRTTDQRDRARSQLDAAPLDTEQPLEFLIREVVKTRTPDQNSLMWVGPIADITQQCFVQRRKYAPETWHIYFKTHFLPEFHDEEQTKEGYQKWDIDPEGNRVLIGSTTQLTIYGFSLYLEQIHAFGSGMGVKFSEGSKSQLIDIGAKAKKERNAKQAAIQKNSKAQQSAS